MGPASSRFVALYLAVVLGGCGQESNRRSPPPEVARVEEALRAGDLAGARETSGAMVAGSPWSWEAHYYLGLTEALLARYDEAIGALRRAAGLAPANAEIQRLLAASLLKGYYPQEALKVAEQAVRLAPGRTDHQVLLAQALIAIGERDRAAQVLRRAVAQDPRSVDAHFQLGLLYTVDRADPERVGQAAEAFQTVTRLSPTHAQAYYQLALLTEAPEAALELLRRAARLAPNDPGIQYNLARILSRLGREEEARAARERFAHLQEVQEEIERIVSHEIERSSGAAGPRLQLAGLLLREGRLSEAESRVREALALAPGSVEAHRLMGLLEVRRGRYREALVWYWAVARAAPEDPEVFRDLAKLYEGLGMDHEKRLALQRYDALQALLAKEPSDSTGLAPELR